ncbi:MAG: 3-methyl-2-oxobutanoate dehydrogenase subunit VorB [Ignavibacteriales bacterium]|nr:3-methyl-2-oxobutanoate dehydrogenase subunit VorB [Ignavibacteriales bacterium]
MSEGNGKDVRLMKGNEAFAEAAIRAGMDAYFGYPITPQSEALEYLTREIPKRQGVVVQAESEVAAINMIYGAAGAGARVMTSSSSPGVSLMQEGISYIASAELPCLLVNINRGGPGLGTIQPSQGDYFQSTRGGGHGDYRTPVLAPATVQEMVDFVFEGFRIAEEYRTPTLILADGALGQMMERVELPPEGSLPHEIPSWATTGKTPDRESNVITSLFIEPEKMEKVNEKLQEKYRSMEKEITFEAENVEDADIVVVAYGLSSRISQKAMHMAREKGIRVGSFRPKTLYPFPYEALGKLAETAKSFLVVEMNAGQMVEDVKLAVNGKRPVGFKGRMGGMIPDPDEILAAIENIDN